jgi:hypothetical protein
MDALRPASITNIWSPASIRSDLSKGGGPRLDRAVVAGSHRRVPYIFRRILCKNGRNVDFAELSARCITD